MKRRGNQGTEAARRKKPKLEDFSDATMESTGVRRSMKDARYRMLAVDLDGTLLDRSGKPHARDIAALRALVAAGGIVTIVTGRLFAGTREAAELIGIRGPVACADGSHLVDAETGATLQHHGIDKNRGDVLRSALRTHGLATFVFKHNAIVHDARGDAFLPYVQMWSNQIERTEEVWNHGAFRSGDVTAVVALGSETDVTSVVAHVRNNTLPSLQMATFAIQRLGELWGFIARADSVSKGTALGWLANHHKCTVKEIVCVGDWLNDLPMMSVAGRSFAMGQSPAEVKAAATDVLLETSAQGGGIARVVEEVFGVTVGE